MYVVHDNALYKLTTFTFAVRKVVCHELVASVFLSSIRVELVFFVFVDKIVIFLCFPFAVFLL